MAKKPKVVTLGRHEYRVLDARPVVIFPMSSAEAWGHILRIGIGFGIAVGIRLAMLKLTGH